MEDLYSAMEEHSEKEAHVLSKLQSKDITLEEFNECIKDLILLLIDDPMGKISKGSNIGNIINSFYQNVILPNAYELWEKHVQLMEKIIDLAKADQ